MTKAPLALTALLLAGFGPRLAAEAPPPIVVDESIDVRVVNVEAVVTDRGGHVAHGLAAGDFQLLVDGREVPISYFTEIRGAQAVAAPQPAAPAAANGAPAPAPAAPSPQVEPGTAVGRHYLVFVDDGFAVGARRNLALERLRDGLRRLGPEDRMAVIVFDGANLAVLSGWTADQAALAAALRRAAAGASRGNQLLAQRHSLDNDEDEVRFLPEQDVIEHALEELRPRVSPEALGQLVRTAAAAAAALRAFELPPGRRILLLLSGGWSVATDPRQYGPLIQAANQLGYTLYPLDVATGDISALRLFDGLAQTTGGRALATGGPAAFAQVVEETASYYWLGFSPTWKPDDHPHRIEVRVHRAGLQVRSRSSYSDMSRQSTAALKAQSALLFGSAGPSPGAAEAQLRVETGASRPIGHDEIEVPITLLLPMSSLSFTPDGASLVAELPLAVAALDDKGRRVDLPETLLHFRIAAIPAASRTLRFRTTLKLRRVEQRLVFAIADSRTGAVLTTELAVHPGS